MRLIDADGAQLGVVSLNDAMAKAQERELDLILISPNSKPPVCKISDFGKFKYEIMKKEKEARKTQKSSTLKEIKLTPKIDKHDLDVRIRHTNELLKKGHKIKIILTFRGREITHKQIGENLISQMLAATEEAGKVDQPPKFEGKILHVVLSPK